MFTISNYALHPLAARLVTVWRNAQAVSAQIDRVVVATCCRCCDCEDLPLSLISDTSKHSSVGYQFIEKDKAGVQPEPIAPQQPVLDSDPGAGDTLNVEAQNERWQAGDTNVQLKSAVMQENKPDFVSSDTAQQPETTVPNKEDIAAVHIPAMF